jgi:serine/threonine-protein kinase
MGRVAVAFAKIPQRSKKPEGMPDVAAPDRRLYPWAFSSDGKTLVVVDTPDPLLTADISMISMEGDHAPKPLLQNPDYFKTQPKISPDGRWIAYVCNESGKNEVYVRPFPEVNKGQWQVSRKGGASPLWAPNGRELFYFSEDDGSVMTVAVETAQAFSSATPKKLFSRLPYLGGGTTPGDPWDIHPDGMRFLMLKLPGATPSAPGGPRKINIILNWFEELKQRAPVKWRCCFAYPVVAPDVETAPSRKEPVTRVVRP